VNDWVPRANIRGPVGSQGATGAVGPPNVLIVGTVETVLPTEPAVVTITGSSPSQVINFEIPQGPPGPGAAGINKGTGQPVFAGADPGTGIMEFWRIRGANQTSVTLDASGLLISSLVNWSNLPGIPATFPPTLPIASSGITGLDAAQAAQDTAITGKVAKIGDTMTGPLVLPAGSVTATSINFGTANTGLFGSSTDVRIAAGGSTRLTIINSSITATVRILEGDGTVAAPSFAFTNDVGSGLYRAGAGDLRLTMGGADVVKFLTSDKSTTFFGKAITLASIAAAAGLILPHGAAPTTPVNGDIWTTTAGVFARINGVTVGPLAAAGTSTATVSTTAPSSPVAGAMWWNTTTLTFNVWDGTAWQTVLGTWG
jgi:hypothetical protein